MTTKAQTLSKGILALIVLVPMLAVVIPLAGLSALVETIGELLVALADLIIKWAKA